MSHSALVPGEADPDAPPIELGMLDVLAVPAADGMSVDVDATRISSDGMDRLKLRVPDGPIIDPMISFHAWEEQDRLEAEAAATRQAESSGSRFQRFVSKVLHLGYASD